MKMSENDWRVANYIDINASSLHRC